MLLDGTRADAIAACADALRDGQLVALPTETVYGLAADAGNDAAVAQVFATKGRPADHPLIVHLQDVDPAGAGLDTFAVEVPDWVRTLARRCWPGPLTLILRRRPGVATAAAGGHDTVGLRCPAHPVAQALLRACAARGVAGLAAPSANRFGRVSPTTAAHVREEFGDALRVLDGGACGIGIESTILDCTRGAPVLLRPGAITPDQVLRACGQAVRRPDAVADAPAPRASGTLEAHYAPRARVRLMEAQALQTALDMLGSDVQQSQPVIAAWARSVLRSRSRGVLVRRMPDDAASAAQQLFAVLRAFDALDVRLIWVETPPPGTEWDGVRDRLQRAAAAQ